MASTTVALPLVKAAFLRAGMEEVKGWLDRSTALYLAGLEVLQRVEGVEGDVCEIGVHHGKSFLALALGLPEHQRAVAIDVFEDQDLNVDKSGCGDREVFEQNLARHGAGANVEIIKASSLELDAAGFFEPGRRFRMFSIDGGHTAEVTCNDLQVAERTLVEAGVVALDDVLNPQWLGVMTGLFRYWSQGGTLAPFAAVPGKLLLAGDAGQAKAYRELLHDWFGDGVVKRDVPIGDGHLVDVLGDFPWRVLDEGGGIAPLAGEPVVAGLTAVRSRTVALDYLTGLQQGCHERDRLRAERDALVKARRTPPPMHRRAMRKLKRLARPVVRLVRSARDSRRPS